MFHDRTAAGRQLAKVLAALKLTPPMVVLGLPRGGVPVASEVARALHVPLDVMVVRKIGMPGQPELAIGAIASGGIVVRDRDVAGVVDDAVFEDLLACERRELARRERAYRGDKGTVQLRGKTVVLVDDGLATGATMTAAVRAVRKVGALSIVVAAPVASAEAVERLEAEVDRLVILETPPLLYSIGEWYQRFDQLEDQDVKEVLSHAESMAS